MRRSLIIGCLALCSCTAGLILGGCAPGEKKLSEAESQIAQLSQKGVPDSILSSAKVFLANVRNSKRLGNSGVAMNNADSLFFTIKKAEAWLAATTTTVKPYIDSVKKVITEQKKALTELQLKEADSLVGAVDAIVAKNQLPEAKAKIIEVEGYMATLIADEQKATELKKLLVGTWKGEFEPEKGKPGINAVNKQTITFKKDGTFTKDDAMKGQTAESLKEDWQFLSDGKWQAKGDTAILNVKHEKCVRQVYQHLKGSKWISDPNKTYDSTYTDGHKDQFIVKSYLTENFKK